MLNQRIIDYWSLRAQSYGQHQHKVMKDATIEKIWTKVWADALPQTSSKVLDLGTGTGFVANICAELGHDVTGVDASSAMLEEAKKESAQRGVSVEYRMGDAAHLPEDLGMFDIITCRYLTWTLSKPAESFKLWQRFLKLGGRVIIVDAPWFTKERQEKAIGESEEVEDHFRRYYDDAVISELPLYDSSTMSVLATALKNADYSTVYAEELSELNRYKHSTGEYDTTDSAPEFRIVAYL